MRANDTNNTNSRIIYPELSYAVTGILFGVQNEKGRYCREKQYCDAIEDKLKELKIPYKRELTVPGSGDRIDFLVDDKIAIEVKAKRVSGKTDYFQLQRYLQTLDIKLGLLINFRSQFLKPKRIVKIETAAKGKFV